MYQHLLYEQRGPITLITFNRPEKMNAIGPQMARELVEAWTRFRDDERALVAVLTGAGERAFCAGGDIPGWLSPEGGLLDLSPAEIEAHNRGERPGIIGPTRWTDIYKPTIAAVNGLAYAGGLEWACWADIRIADAHATFGVTCRRWNIGLGDGGTQRLPRIIGLGRAMELIVTGRVIDAYEAERIGLVNEVVPSGTCLQRALDLAATIAALPQPAIRTDKEAAVRGSGRPLEEGLRIEAECFNRLLATPEIREGARRFVEREHPDRDPAGGAITPGLDRGGRPLATTFRAGQIHPTAFIGQGAIVVGDVTLGEESSVWFNATLRGDTTPIVVGAGSNIQEGSILHADPGYPTTIGRGVTVGHGAIVHGATVGDNSLIGMRALLLNGAVVGENSLVAAGSVLTGGKVYPPGSMIMGTPARVVRPLTPDEIAGNRRAAAEYVDRSRTFRQAGLNAR